jgi:hypothetical protein
MKSIADLVDKYSGEPTSGPTTVGYTCRVTEEAKIKLLHLSSFLEVKRTRLAGELLEAAINEAFEQVFENFNDEQHRAFAEDMQDYEEHNR